MERSELEMVERTSVEMGGTLVPEELVPAILSGEPCSVIGTLRFRFRRQTTTIRTDELNRYPERSTPTSGEPGSPRECEGNRASE